MRPADLWRRTSFRLALSTALFILASLIVASAVGYALMRQQLILRQDARVTEIFNSLEQIRLQVDQQDLVETVTTRITASPDKSTIYLLKNAAGKVLASNIADVWIKPGWSTVEAATLGIETDYPYRIYAGMVSDNLVVVGLTNADLDDLAETVLAAFGWSALFALVAAIGGGVVIANRIQTRLAQAEATLLQVARGDLSARLPLTPRGDDLDQMSGAINQTLHRLGEVVEAMRQVSTDVAHDLRTPLNRLRIMIEAAADKAVRGEAVGDDLTAAQMEIDTINQTFSALLRIAQIEGGARREKFAPLDLGDLLTNLADIYQDVAEDAVMTLRCRIAGPAPIVGDRELLTQMFANLIENAIRHCPPGTVISCDLDLRPPHILATVSDTGPGIPAQARDLVLRRLYRLEQSRTTPGSGLGLSLVKAVADLHEASLTLSDAQPGLRVSLLFHKAMVAGP